jgi:hypothetical protein
MASRHHLEAMPSFSNPAINSSLVFACVRQAMNERNLKGEEEIEKEKRREEHATSLLTRNTFAHKENEEKWEKNFVAENTECQHEQPQH